jgi:hypothetical protein
VTLAEKRVTELQAMKAVDKPSGKSIEPNTVSVAA